MSRDFDKAQEMVWASMDYVKVLGFRLRRTEGQRDDWKNVAQSHAEELIKCRQQIDALKGERNALRSTTIDTATGHLLDAFGSLANEPRLGATDDEYRDRIVTKIHTIKLERDALRAQLDTERERHKQTASILAQYAPKTMQIEPPPEATHDTPAGKQAAESAIKREPKPGDVVRLIRQCEGWDPIWGRIGDLGTVLRITTYPQGPKGVTIREKGGLDWPLSCVEIVEDAK